MAIDINHPLYRELVNEGLRRGYPKFSVAAAVGNSAIEAPGANTRAIGDSGTAFGGFQWRKERQDALRAKAAAAGLDPSDPRLQAQHFWDEQDGSEAKAGLRNAVDLTSANNAVISSLRPKGFNPNSSDQSGALGYAARLANSNDALGAIGGAAPTQNPGLVTTQNSPVQVAEGPTETTTDIPPTSWGDKLIGAGAALASINSPEQGAALRGLVSKNTSVRRAVTNQQHFQDKGFKKTADGNWFRETFNPATGQAQRMPVSQEQIPADVLKEDADLAKVKSDEVSTKDYLRAQKPFQENEMAMNRATTLNDDINAIRDRIVSGNLKLGTIDQTKSWIDNLLENTDDNDAELKNAFARIKQGVLQNVKDFEKGATSKAQLTAAQEATLPAGGQFSTRTLLDSLDRLSQSNTAAYKARANANGSLLKSVPKLGDTGQVDPETGEPVTSEWYHKSMNSKLKQYDDFEKSYGAKKKQFVDKWNAERTPSKTSETSKEQYDALPVGATYVKDGKTYRKK